MSGILSLDTRIFRAINNSRCDFLDYFLGFISSHFCIGIIVTLIIIYVMKKYNWKYFYIYIIFIGLCFLISDRSSVLFFKDVFHRLRPSHALENVYTVKFSHFHYIYNNKGGLYGFVSSHQANVFSIITLMSIIMLKKIQQNIEKKKNIIFIITMILWGLLVGYSRIYCGYHYPSDVICGSFLGIVIGFLLYLLYKKIMQFIFIKNKDSIK